MPFSSLPLELRHHIWSFCTPSPRIVTFKLDCARIPDLYTQTPQPLLLSINRETRSFLLQQGGYVLIRVINTHVAFHPLNDRVHFEQILILQQGVHDLVTEDGESIPIKNLVVEENMVAYLVEHTGFGRSLQDWFVESIDVLGVISKRKGFFMSILLDRLAQQMEGRSRAPKIEMLDMDCLSERDQFCGDLVRPISSG